MKAREKIAALRQLMQGKGLTAYLVPSTDPHQSEYVPLCWQRRAYLSGFTGSAGDLLVTAKDAGLWTDGRYFLQAEQELRGSGIRLYKMGEPKTLTLREHLARSLKTGDSLGVDPRVVSMAQAKDLENALEPAGAKLILLQENLVDRVWTDRPSAPRDPIRIHEQKYAGETVVSKLRRLRKFTEEKEAGAHVLSALDAIAWLYNIRGNDTSYNPVAIAYALITPKSAHFFIDPEKVPSALSKKLAPTITLEPYEALEKHLQDLAASQTRVWLDEAATSRWIQECLQGCSLVKESSPVTRMKAKKNEVEIQGMRAAHDRDGVALARFFHWLESAVPAGGVTESSAARKLEEFRAGMELFQGNSFETISGYAGHGAIIHYRVTRESDAPLRPEGLFLLDSGGQYLDGTIDTTRTVLLGKTASKEIKERFTRVLKGNIALASCRFPVGTRGIQLDTLARKPLWEAGLNYNHGTGHGVGAYLCVHEGPQSITPFRDSGVPLDPGNILSNEPGFYVADSYGIRTENLILVVEDGEARPQGPGFLRFQTITRVPIDTKLLDLKLLSPIERAWLNDYHKTVYKVVAPRLEAGDRQWLKKACAPI